jgi:AraC family transcriptional regulator
MEQFHGLSQFPGQFLSTFTCIHHANQEIMEAEIIFLKEKKLIGMSLLSSFSENNTPLLWKRFMPRRHEIPNRTDNNLVSLRVFQPGFSFENFHSELNFHQWAAVEVSHFQSLPSGMQSHIIPAGNFAKFRYKGASSGGDQLFQFIFMEWLPQSGFQFTAGFHFEVLGNNYKNDSTDSEEEIWIPIQK